MHRNALFLTLPAWLAAVTAHATDSAETLRSRHVRGDYPLRIQPHPELGKLKPQRDPDRPIMAFYGGIGLHDLGNGQWTGYNINARSDIDLLIARCREYGIHRIYASLLEQSPPSELLAPPPERREDLIPYAIERAHAAGIQVYADVPAFAVFERLDQPFVDANPQMLTRDERGQPTPHMLSPAWPKVRAYKRAVILEVLSRYPVDGIQLDFIRWPYYGHDLLHGHCAHGYDEPLLDELRRRHNLPPDFKPASDDPRFFQIRREMVSLFIRELRDALRRSGIQLPIGVYNSNAYGRIPSLHDVCQDWERWEVDRLVDEHHPMFLMDSLARLGRATQSLIDVKRRESIVFGPLFLAEAFHPEDGFAPTPELCRDAARRLIKLGCDGIWVCRASELEQFKLWPVIREIGGYSLSRIRAEEFDPLDENLIANGDFKSGASGWTLDPGAVVADGRGQDGGAALAITLNEGRPVAVVQAADRLYCRHPAMAVRSLGLSFSVRAEDVRAPSPPRVVLTLKYTDGSSEERAFSVTTGQTGWHAIEEAFRVTREPPQRLLKSTRLRIEAPAGTGTLVLDDIELTYDPLDNPLKMSAREASPDGCGTGVSPVPGRHGEPPLQGGATEDGTTTAPAETPWHFRGPFGVAVSSKDVVYVAEIDNARVSKFTAAGEWLGTIRTIEGYGELKGPFDVAIGPHDRIYIADTRNHRIVVLDERERLQFVLGQGRRGAAPGSFGEPHFVAVNRAGEIFVSDTFNARVQKFSPRGEFLKQWGRIGEKPGEFLLNGYLGGIACDNRGHVYVRETDGGRIQKFTEDGKHVLTIGQRGIGPGEFDEGYGAAVHGDTLWAADTFENRVQRFTLDGRLIDIWAPGHGNSGHRFNHPVDTAVTSAGEVIVTDWKNNRVLKLGPKGDFRAIWGATQDDLLAWTPPKRIVRPCRSPIVFSAYASVSDRDLEACRRAGITIIYPSFDHQDGEWGIAGAVEKARSMGIQVHPSIAMLTFGQHSEFSREHPELHMWKKDAREPLGGILSWAEPRARTFRAEHLARQAARTGVDGIMLDYIRYLGTDFGYDPAAIEAFRARYGVDPRTLEPTESRWMQLRADDVTEFIVELRRRLADLNQQVELSAYMSLYERRASLEASLQDWLTWAKMGVVDKLHVAPYTRDFPLIYESVRKVREAVPDRMKVNCFLACYGGNLNTPALLRKGVEAAIAGGADEITIYRGDAIWELDLWDAIKAIVEDVHR